MMCVYYTMCTHVHVQVPFDLNLGSKQFGEFFVNDSIDYHSTAALRSMPFLSPYIPELEPSPCNLPT